MIATDGQPTIANRRRTVERDVLQEREYALEVAGRRIAELERELAIQRGDLREVGNQL